MTSSTKRSGVELFAILAAIGSAYGLLQYLERSRTIEGTWLWQFEGSNFYETLPAGNPCALLAKSGSWLGYRPDQVFGNYDYRKTYPSSGVDWGQYGPYRLESFRIKFVGRKIYSPLGTGHMGMWRSRFEVERVISVEPINGRVCRFPYRDQ